MTKEIVSLQVGTYANYVGAHFWNLQDEYLATPVSLRELSPTALFREVSPASRAFASGLLYAPRLQIIDSTGAFGALSTDAGIVLPQQPAKSALPDPAWKGHHDCYVRPLISPSAYTKSLHEEEAHLNPKGDDSSEDGSQKNPDLEGEVRYWSDFLKTRLHPKTCANLRGVHYGVNAMDHFEVGQSISNSSLLDDIYDNLRFFIEDCDSLGGIQVTTNADDAFAGLTATYLSHITEEVGSSVPIVMFGVHAVDRLCGEATAKKFNKSFDRQAEFLYAKNEAQLVSTCLERSTEYIPLSSRRASLIPTLRLKENDRFHASAALGLALDVALIPIRQRPSLSGLLSALRPAPFASFGSMVCNIPRVLKRQNFRRVVDMEGTISFSDAYEPKPRRNSPNGARTLRCPAEVISSRGFNPPLPVFASVSLPVAVPIPFPSIFVDLESAKEEKAEGNAEGVQLDQISVISGFASLPVESKAALKNLSHAIRDGSTHNRTGSEADDLSEVHEALSSRADDYDTL